MNLEALHVRHQLSLYQELPLNLKTLAGDNEATANLTIEGGQLIPNNIENILPRKE